MRFRPPDPDQPLPPDLAPVVRCSASCTGPLLWDQHRRRWLHLGDLTVCWSQDDSGGDADEVPLRPPPNGIRRMMGP
jgi:hypothetical protein